MIKFKDFLDCLTDYADDYDFIQVYEIGEYYSYDLLYEGSTLLLIDRQENYLDYNFVSLNIDINGDENIQEGLPFIVLYIKKG